MYQPLDPNKNEIRVLRLKSRQYNRDEARDQKELICFLESKSLEDPLKYVALSYTWENGYASVPQEISLASNQRSVSSNLADALRQLRREFEDVIVWADQLCINQDDLAEKASQILKMKSIFAKASTVVAWLGVSSPNTDLVFTTLRHIHAHKRALWRSPSGIMSEIARGLNQTDSETVWDTALVLNRLSTALPEFASRRYWNRLWVLQEYVVATKVLVTCGGNNITNGALSDAWRLLERAANAHDLLAHLKSPAALDILAIGEIWRRDSSWWDSWLAVQRLVSQRAEYQSRRPHSNADIKGHTFYNIMMRNMTTFSGQKLMECADPRDRVFSLLGVAIDAHEFDQFPDYARSVESIYEELAQKFLQQGHADALSFCQEELGQRRRNMASWAADWSNKIRLPLWGKLENINASQGWWADLQISILNSSIIKLSGTIVGTIKSHGPCWSQKRPLTLAQSKTLLEQLKAFCGQSSLIPASWETMTCAKVAAPSSLAYMDNVQMMSQHHALVTQLERHDRSDEEDEPQWGMSYSSVYEREVRQQPFRCPFITANGYVGIAPPFIQEGDCVCIFPGGCIPYILRQDEGSGRFRIAGAAFVGGIMNGEYFGRNREAQFFTLV
jgi:hypothetical protein